MAGGWNRRSIGVAALAGTRKAGLLRTTSSAFVLLMLGALPASVASVEVEALTSPVVHVSRATTDAAWRSSGLSRESMRTDDGLAFASTYTYTVDPLASAIHVVAVFALTNTVPNERSGNYINQTYFSGFSVPVPVEAVGVTAMQNESPIAVTLEPVEADGSLVVANINFAAELFYNRTADVVLSYDLAGGAPRDAGMTRINAAYTSFTAFGVADPGALTVSVIVPPAYVIDTLGSDMVHSVDELGNTVYTATDIALPDEFALFISARNDAALTTETRAVDSTGFVVKSWPDDTAWREFINDRLDRGVPALEELIGRPWPETETVVISEAVTSYLYGYAGWYNSDSKNLELGEDLDSQVVLHEVSHVWFNGQWYEDRWITEGLAQQYSGLANEELGETAVSPAAIDPGGVGAVPLSGWDDPLGSDTANDTEDFGYNAAWFVIDGIVDDIGVDGMQDVFEATDAGTISYVGDAPPERLEITGDWRRFLDLTEIIGGSTAAPDLISLYVVSPDEQLELDERVSARGAYAELETAGDGWAPPLVIRKHMSRWRFDEAGALMSAATDLLTERDSLVATLTDLGVKIDSALESEYEASMATLDAASALLDDAVARADAVMRTRTRAIQGLASLEIEPTSEFTTATVPAESSLDDVAIALEDVIDATADVRGAVDLADADRGLFERIGLVGTDVDGIIIAAKAALAAGDTATARTRADEATALIDDSGGVGGQRAAFASAAAALVVALVLILIVVIRRKRRQRTPSVVEDTGTDRIDEPSKPDEPRDLVPVRAGDDDQASEEPPRPE